MSMLHFRFFGFFLSKMYAVHAGFENYGWKKNIEYIVKAWSVEIGDFCSNLEYEKKLPVARDFFFRKLCIEYFKIRRRNWTISIYVINRWTKLVCLHTYTTRGLLWIHFFIQKYFVISVYLSVILDMTIQVQIICFFFAIAVMM